MLEHSLDLRLRVDGEFRADNLPSGRVADVAVLGKRSPRQVERALREAVEGRLEIVDESVVVRNSRSHRRSEVVEEWRMLIIDASLLQKIYRTILFLSNMK